MVLKFDKGQAETQRLEKLTQIALTASFLGALAKLRKKRLRHVRPSVCPHGTTRLPLDRLSRNLIFETTSKLCPENSSLIKIRQE